MRLIAIVILLVLLVIELGDIESNLADIGHAAREGRLGTTIKGQRLRRA
jgi:hypothetical protein